MNDSIKRVMVHTPSSTDLPGDEYERRIERRRDAATVRLTNVASLGLVFTPLALGLLDIAFRMSAWGPELAGNIIVALIAAWPAAASAALTLYDWPVLPAGKIALGLLPWTLLVLGTTLILLAIV